MLDWEDIQGNVLRGYGHEHACYFVLSVSDPTRGQQWLEALLPEITPASPWGTRPLTTLNVAFTYRGLATLAPDADALSFPSDFSQGMRSRAATLVGDAGPNAPDNWETAGPQDPRSHVLLMIQGGTADACEEAASRALANARAHGLELLATERLRNLPGGKEHFGFADGISQPAVEGAMEPTVVRGNGTPLPDGSWRPVAPGEFILGYPDEEETAPPLPAPEALSRNGSYLVYRKLSQDVAAFRRLLASLSERYGVPPDLLSSKLVGRHADGSPLVPHPGLEAEPGTHPSARLNDVRFADDPLGRVCPVGSHIRRANPRDGLSLPPGMVSRHRLLRRGMPYGPPLPEGVMDDDGVPRGLLFMAYCTGIRRQFEFVQQRWLNDGNPFGVGPTADPIVGSGPAPRRFGCEAPSEAAPDGNEPMLFDCHPPLVHTRGGEYLFQPGLNAIRFLTSP